MKTALSFGDDYFRVVVRAPLAVRRRSASAQFIATYRIDFGFSSRTFRLGTGGVRDERSFREGRRSAFSIPVQLRSL